MTGKFVLWAYALQLRGGVSQPRVWASSDPRVWHLKGADC